jgi:hypothetical protein
MTAIAINVVRLGAWLTDRPIAKIWRSSFNALASAAASMVPSAMLTVCHQRTLREMLHSRRSIQAFPLTAQALAVIAALFVASPTWAESLTGPQNNAVRSANQYLSIGGFSRSGLIQQLSSDVGDGYKIADATVAVDSLNIDWNKEAVKSAKQYLSISGFSCKGLIQQLSSSAGDGYTVSQATYGAQQAGACQ